MLIVNPGNRIGLTRHAVERVRGLDELVLLGVDVLKVNAAGAENARNFVGVQVDDRHTVVFLQRDGQLVAAVDRHVLRFEVLRSVKAGLGDLGQGSAVLIVEANRFGLPIRGGVAFELDRLDEAGRHLGEPAVALVFVTFVFNRNCCALAVGADGNRVGLAAQIVGADLFAVAQLDDVNAALGVFVVLAGFADDDEHVFAHYCDRGRFIVRVAKGCEADSA